MLNLSTQTVMYMAFVASMVELLVITRLWQQNRGRFPGLSLWTLDFACQLATVALVGMRGSIPLWASVVLANFLGIGGMLMLYLGLRLFLKKPLTPLVLGLSSALIVIFAAIHTYFTFVNNSLLARNFNTNSALFVLSTASLWLVLRDRDGANRRFSGNLVAPLTAICLVEIVRIAGFFFEPLKTNDFLQSGTLDSALMGLLYASVAYLVFGLVLMVNQRLAIETETLNKDLSQTADRLRAIFNNGAVGLAVVTERKITEINDTMCRMLGMSRQELIGTNTRPLYVTEEEYADVGGLYSRLSSTGIETTETRILRKEGTILSVLANMSALDKDDLSKGVIIAVIDITDRKKAQEALETERGNFRRSLEDSPFGIQIVDFGGRLLYVNRTMLSLWGYETLEELRQIPMRAAFDADSLDLVRRMFRDRSVVNSPEIHELTIVNKKGDRRIVRVHPKQVIWNGETCLQMLYEDRTLISRTEEALRVSEEHYRELYERMGQGVLFQEASGKVIAMNPAAERLLGVNLEEIGHADMVNRNLTCIHEDGSPFPAQEHPSMVALRTGAPVRAAVMGVRSHNKDAYRWLLISAIPEFRDGDQQPHRVSVTFDDITLLRESEEALKQSRNQFQALVETTSDFIWEMNQIGQFTYCSPQCVSIWGYSPSDLLGETPFDRMAAEDREKWAPVFNAAAEKQEPIVGLQVPAQNRDGSRVFLEINGVPFFDPAGRFCGYRGVTRDITERKRAEAEKESLRTKAEMASRLAAIGEMAAGVAHEINNPLTGVLGFSNLLLETGGLPNDVTDSLKIIADGSQRAADVVKRLLIFARQNKPVRARVNISELVENTIKLRQYVLRTSNIEVKTDLPPDLSWIAVDAGQMQQVFLNIIVNAEQAIRSVRQSGTITVSTSMVADKILVTFKDDGPGISAEVAPHLFEPFFTTKQPGEGTGLGLSLSHSIVLEHGGNILVDSQVGHGATFTIELPHVLATPNDNPPEGIAVDQASHERKKTILVADDEPSIQNLLQRALTGQGHSVSIAADAPTALRLTSSSMFDLIILDVRMPGMSGFELYRRISEGSPSGRQRFLFITGDTMAHETKSFLSAHHLPFLGKPFTISDLIEKVNRTE